MKNTYIIEDGWLGANPVPNEKERLDVLGHLDVLDTDPEQAFDIIVSLLHQNLDTPIALVSLVDKDRQWFKSCIGLDAKETPRDQSFCSHAIWSDEVMVVEDTHLDDRFKKNPLVTGGPKIRFYMGAPLIIKSGIRIGTLCAIDTKPRQAISEKDIQLISNLAKLVVDELELRQAKKDADRSNQAKSTFLACMSHEIRTPLNGIIGLTDILETTPLNTKQKEYLGLVKESSDFLLNLVNDILDFSKIESGKINLEAVSLDLVAICNKVINLISLQVDQSNIEIIKKYDPKIDFRVLADPLRLEQVLVNLLNNAVKFTMKGSITLSLELLEQSDDCVTVKFSVSDSGIGIKEENQSKIFKLFEQSDSSTTREFGGTGLGLSISQQLLEQMGSKISLKSDYGRGSNFSFEIEFEKSTDIQSGNNNEMTKPGDRDSINKKLSILLVEDNDINQIVAKEMLSQMGHTVTIAKDGLEAIHRVKTAEVLFDVILMDCQMPVMDGYESTRMIQAFLEEKGRSSIPIVAMTANTIDGEKQKCLSAGMDDFLAKPIRKQDMASILDGLF